LARTGTGLSAAKVERPLLDSASADLVGERREADLDPLQGIALALSV